MGEPAPWQLIITPRAERELKDAEAQVQSRIRVALDHLARNPGQADISKLAGSDDEWRLRVGTWRVRFRFSEEDRLLVVLRVLPRRDAYRQRR